MSESELTTLSINDESVDFSAMTKAQLQAYADEHNIDGVNSTRQTKAEMIATIEGA